MCHFSCAPTIFLYFSLRINKYNLPSNDFEENFVSILLLFTLPKIADD
jgi:hypothetical protein